MVYAHDGGGTGFTYKAILFIHAEQIESPWVPNTHIEIEISYNLYNHL